MFKEYFSDNWRQWNEQFSITRDQNMFRKIPKVWVDHWWLRSVAVVESEQVGMHQIIKNKWGYLKKVLGSWDLY